MKKIWNNAHGAATTPGQFLQNCAFKIEFWSFLIRFFLNKFVLRSTTEKNIK